MVKIMCQEKKDLLSNKRITFSFSLYLSSLHTSIYVPYTHRLFTDQITQNRNPCEHGTLKHPPTHHHGAGLENCTLGTMQPTRQASPSADQERAWQPNHPLLLAPKHRLLQPPMERCLVRHRQQNIPRQQPRPLRP